MKKHLTIVALVVSALFAGLASPVRAASSVVVAGVIGATDPTFTHLANHTCTTSSGQTTHYDAIQFFTVGNSPTTISVSVTPSGFTGAVFLYQGGFLPDAPIVNCYDTASSVVGTVSGGTLTFSTNFGALPSPFTEEPWTLVVTTDTAASPGGSYSATIGSSATGVALPSTTTITGVTPEPSTAGQPVVVHYDVASEFGGTPPPSGTVAVTTDGAESCTGSVAAGQCTIVFTGVGDRQLTATYSGDAIYQSSADFTDHTVNPGATTMVTSITRADASPTNKASVKYTITFADAVTGLTPAALTLVSGGSVTGAAVTSVSGGATAWSVTVGTGTGSGTLRLDLTDTSGITPAVGNVPFAGEVYVVDKTPPVVSAPANQVAEATGPSGAVVTYPAATAVDAVDGPLTPTCIPASGSTFALGTTTVTCSATDAAGNTGSATFTVTVHDTTAPVYGPAPNVTVNATSPAGAVVTFPTPPATDAVGVSSNVCTPASGATFPVGTTTVTCLAADAAGNVATTTFTVTVVSAAGQIDALLQQVQSITPQPKLGGSLSNKLTSALAALEAGDTQDACGTLQGFINEVNAQSGKKLSTADAASLVAAATQIRAALGC
ncbi:MAG TPA: HYR domain-containing protein [Gaiellaceae bacterium]|nr:HYR domain-containing protein [Gaiellaceae bacterium]